MENEAVISPTERRVGHCEVWVASNRRFKQSTRTHIFSLVPEGRTFGILLQGAERPRGDLGKGLIGEMDFVERFSECFADFLREYIEGFEDVIFPVRPFGVGTHG